MKPYALPRPQRLFALLASILITASMLGANLGLVARYAPESAHVAPYGQTLAYGPATMQPSGSIVSQ